MPGLAAPAAAPAPAAPPPAVPDAAAGSERAYIESFLEYRLAVQLKIEEAWAGYLDKFRHVLPRGRVAFTYHVNPDGKITLVEPRDGSKNSPVLALAHRSIVEANKVPAPLPEAVRTRHPSGYFNQIAFAVK